MQPRTRLYRNPSRSSTGLTLVEIMIAAGVFAVVMSAIIAVTMQSRRLAEDNKFAVSALTVVNAYMEQINATQPYSSLLGNTLTTRDQSGFVDTLTIGFSSASPVTWASILSKATSTSGTAGTREAVWGNIRTQYTDLPAPLISAARPTVPSGQSWQGNIRLLDINNTVNNVADDLLIEIKPIITDRDSAGNTMPYVLIQVFYRYQPPTRRGTNFRITGSIQTVRANLPNS